MSKGILIETSLRFSTKITTIPYKAKERNYNFKTNHKECY